MSAPGYQSWAWTQQDWRTVQLHADGSWSYDRACGDGSTLPSGRKRLCLPRAVLDTLARSAEGRRIVREQAQRKQGAKPGTRVQWHPKIRSLVKALDRRTPADRKQRRNPMARKAKLPSRLRQVYDVVVVTDYDSREIVLDDPDHPLLPFTNKRLAEQHANAVWKDDYGVLRSVEIRVRAPVAYEILRLDPTYNVSPDTARYNVWVREAGNLEHVAGVNSQNKADAVVSHYPGSWITGPVDVSDY